MEDYNKGNQQNDSGRDSRNNESIGNQQGTTQTGAQNAGGENIDEAEDQYSDDLRHSGDRKARD